MNRAPAVSRYRALARVVIVAIVALAVAACGDVRDGLRAYDEGRHVDAHRALSAAVDAAGDGAAAELVYDRALAALRAGDIGDAERSVARAAQIGEGDLRAACDFLAGNVAFARCDLAERQASTEEAEPFAFDIAIEQARTARRHWVAAAITRDDWPEARRNVERVDRRIEALRAKKAEAEARKRRKGPKDRRPQPRAEPRPGTKSDGAPPAPPEGTGAAQGGPTDEGADPQVAELTPAEVARLLDRVAEKEREKLAAREKRRSAPTPAVERDW